jgi:hypothetical protein
MTSLNPSHAEEMAHRLSVKILGEEIPRHIFNIFLAFTLIICFFSINFTNQKNLELRLCIT